MQELWSSFDANQKFNMIFSTLGVFSISLFICCFNLELFLIQFIFISHSCLHSVLFGPGFLGLVPGLVPGPVPVW